MRAAALCCALVLSGCAGTQAEMAGEICGQQVQLTLVDRKDRSSFEAHVECPQGGGVTVSSSESSTSAVLDAQISLLDRLAALVTDLAAP